MKQFLKRTLLATMGGVTRRTAVLLAAEAGHEAGILSVVAPYRIEGDTLRVHVTHPEPGDMQVTVTGLSSQPVAARFEYASPGTIALRLADGTLAFDGRRVGGLSNGARVMARRFSMHLELAARTGVCRRVTSHYVPRDGQPIDGSYFSGEDYVDYEAQSAAAHRDVLELACRHAMQGPVLEIGCATGGTLDALRQAGIEAFGVDISEWAVERARARLGDVAWQCDFDRDPLPAAVAGRAPFNGLVLASVLEHFAHPKRALDMLTAVAARGAVLIIVTTNAESLTHRVLGRDWEGYFDWTHRGVDAVTPGALRYWLTDLGWTTRELRTWHVWDSSSDPTHATLRDWYTSDARFRTLLAERDLGDFITCVAVRA